MTERFGLYFAPAEGTALDRFGTSWLGRSAWTGDIVPQPAIESFTETEIREITVSPRRYGFHATLKPPFALTQEYELEELVAAISAFAASCPGFLIAPLQVKAIGRFIALVPGQHEAELHALADACVERFDRFRAPPSVAEIAKRKRAALTPRQEEHLVRWGYPYVFDTFRFHMTLTDSLEEGLRDRTLSALMPLAAPLCREPLAVDGIVLFHEPSPGADFKILRRFPLKG